MGYNGVNAHVIDACNNFSAHVIHLRSPFLAFALFIPYSKRVRNCYILVLTLFD